MCSQYDKIVNWFDITRYKGLMEKEFTFFTPLPFSALLQYYGKM